MPDGTSPPPISESRKRLRGAANLHAIEGNPLTDAELAMFEMFERENWSPERRRAHIIASGASRPLSDC
jgi:hypothetical protein